METLAGAIFMRMKIIDLLAILESHAPPALQEDYDNAGLLTGYENAECTGALCCLDVTLEVLKEAEAQGCNLVVAHHPVIFRGLKRITGRNYVEQIVIEAIKKDIAIYAIHTNLDNVLAGVNGVIARKLGLVNTSILQPRSGLLRKLVTFAPVGDAERVREALFAAGAGYVGRYSECSFNSDGTGTFKAGAGTNPHVGAIGEQHREPETRIEVIYPSYLESGIMKALRSNHPYEEVAYDLLSLQNSHQEIGAGLVGELPEALGEEEFLKLLARMFEAQGIRYTAPTGRPVKRVAVCGGAGSFLTRAARQRGADAYVTADVKYHEFFDAEGQLLLADIGHYESEQYTTELIHDLLREKFPNFAVLKSRVNTNPVRYLTDNNLKF